MAAGGGFFFQELVRTQASTGRTVTIVPHYPAFDAESAHSAAEWDSFLAQSPLGQFQQSSGWARVKGLEGWAAQRVLINPLRPEEGGFQLLWKRNRFGRFGYISKGPVLENESAQSVTKALTSLTAVAAKLRLRALILQPPDQSSISDIELINHHFSRGPVESVIRATALIDIRVGRVALENRMHSKARQQTRAARNRGVSIRIGSRSELRTFFALMLESCRRQNEHPNPSRPEALEALWDAFSPRVSLGFASFRGETIAGLLMVGHGTRMTFWKKGWSIRENQPYANCLLNVEALGWACDQGYATVDFAGLDRQIAERLISGVGLTQVQQRGRDMFNLRLGAQPRLLPAARLLVVNPILRRLHRLFSSFPALERSFMHRAASDRRT